MRLFYLFLLMAALLPCYSQTAFTNFTTENSLLPNNFINDLFIDDNQTIWIATEGGIAKIDASQNWTIYTTENSDLPDNYVRSIFVDHEQILWAGTFYAGLAKFDGINWTTYSPANSLLPDYHIRSINEDSNDTLWIGSTSGLTKWDKTDFWYTYTTENSAMLSNNIPAIYIDALNQKFCGSINGGLITVIDGEINYYKTTNSAIGDNTVLSITGTLDGDIWMATTFGGLNLLTASGTFYKFTPYNSDIPSLEMADIAMDVDGNIVNALNTSGLSIFDKTNWFNYDTSNCAITDNHLNTVIVNADNTIWMGSETHGLTVLDRTFLPILTPAMQNTNIAIRPNPAQNVVTIMSNFKFNAITIYTLQGKIVYQNNVDANTAIIEVKTLSAGTYILRVNGKYTTTRQQLIITH